jgi:hypothetical protein
MADVKATPPEEGVNVSVILRCRCVSFSACATTQHSQQHDSMHARFGCSVLHVSTPFRTCSCAALRNLPCACRPPNAQERAERAPQVIQCNETLREVTLYQNISGKQLSRTFRYDKVCFEQLQWQRVVRCAERECSIMQTQHASVAPVFDHLQRQQHRVCADLTASLVPLLPAGVWP